MIGDQRNAAGPWEQVSADISLERLKESRKTMLLMAIAVLESVTPQRAMHAGLEVLHAALADLDGWALGMAEVMRRECGIARRTAAALKQAARLGPSGSGRSHLRVNAAMPVLAREKKASALDRRAYLIPT